LRDTININIVTKVNQNNLSSVSSVAVLVLDHPLLGSYNLGGILWSFSKSFILNLGKTNTDVVSVLLSFTHSLAFIPIYTLFSSLFLPGANGIYCFRLFAISFPVVVF